MIKIIFSKNCDVDIEKVISIIADHKNSWRFLPPQITYTIINEYDDSVEIEEKLVISKLRKEIKQKTIHRKKSYNEYEIDIISGPAKNSKVKIFIQKKDARTEIKVEIELNLGFQYKILAKFIQNKYQIIIDQLLEKIINYAIITNGRKWNECLEENGDVIVLSENNSSLKFYNWWNGDLPIVFGNKAYQRLNVKDKTVLDIGGNIGDSAIYFAIHGAKKVISLEPFPKNVEWARKNIEVNGLEKTIFFELAGCSDKTSNAFIDEESFGTSSKIEHSTEGMSIPTYSLQSLVKKYNIVGGVLKMDCEGCEYDSVLNTKDEDLQKFETILIEYHNGYQNLYEKLSNAQFSVIVEPNKIKEYENRGYIFAHSKQFK